MKKYLTILSLFVILGFIAFSCSDDDKVTWNDIPTYDMTGYAKGADVSWLTEMEKLGMKFYNKSGNAQDCMTLLRDLGVNSIRLRVWVNPENGWNNEDDVLAKAWRAKQLGMRVMIDFHYSDSWADPAHQTKPAIWENLSFDELKKAMTTHTLSVLNRLKDNGITPEWVQVGNETGNGMLWADGKADTNMANYATLTNVGYDAVKSVFPDCKVIVHLQKGEENGLYRWLFDGLKANGAKWDVIGMSLYPSVDNWETMTNDMVANAKDMIERYDKEIMICEVGMPWDEPETCRDFLSKVITDTKSIDNVKYLGVFYWEPQAYGNFEGYTLGAFDNSGYATVALDAFKN